MNANEGPQLDLSWRLGEGACTVLGTRRYRYPFHLTAPLAGGGRQAQLVVQSASGGLYGGEQLHQRLLGEAQSCAELRFPAATVVQDARNGDGAVQRVEIDLHEGARLRYLPRLLILFPGARLVQTMQVRLWPGAHFTAREGFMLHDPSRMDASATPGPRLLISRLRVHDPAGRRLVLDGSRVDDDVLAARLPGITGQWQAFGTLWHIGAQPPGNLMALRKTLAERTNGRTDGLLSSSMLPRDGGLVIRAAARDGAALDSLLDEALELLCSSTDA